MTLRSECSSCDEKRLTIAFVNKTRAMAGGEEYFEVTAEINKWFLDYLCLTTWKNFKESKQVTVGDRDLIQGKTPGFLKHEFSMMWARNTGC